VAGENDEGMALVMVLSVTAVLTVFLTAALAYTVGTAQKASTDDNWNAALAAAYAGIEEYQSRIAEDPSYVKYGNPAAPFSSSSSLVLPAGALENEAFGIGENGAWATVSGSGGTSEYRYEVDTEQYFDTGNVRLRSTGRVGDETRSIVATLKQQGFIDFLYFTDYEIQDPSVFTQPAGCQAYWWATRKNLSDCKEIAFGASDVINGPTHSNDSMRVCGGTFKGPVTTGWNDPTGKFYRKVNSSNSATGCTATFTLPGYPTYSPTVSMPPTNSALKREVRTDLTEEDVPRPGCLYTGPTTIAFAADGTVTVRSPWTKATRVAGDPAASGEAPDACGALAALGSSAGATFALPENNVIYVQNVPTSPSDPNYWAPDVLPTGLTCKGIAASASVDPDDVPDGNGIGFPRANEKSADTAYGCRNGDVFVQGTLDGSLTLAAENYVYVTGDIRYEDANDDMLGLVGNNAVWVWNPVTSGGSSLIGNSGRRIDAAILSVAHTFQVQNYETGGARGTLTVNGAIAQKYRGTVGTSSGNTLASGYAKNYQYDPRFKTTAPPKFLSPTSTTYGVNVWVEVSPAFDGAGRVR
jgi:hypothetical protein